MWDYTSMRPASLTRCLKSIKKLFFKFTCNSRLRNSANFIAPTTQHIPCVGKICWSIADNASLMFFFVCTPQNKKCAICSKRKVDLKPAPQNKFFFCEINNYKTLSSPRSLCVKWLQWNSIQKKKFISNRNHDVT